MKDYIRAPTTAEAQGECGCAYSRAQDVFGRAGIFRALNHLVGAAHDQEDHEGKDHEIDQRGDKIAIGEHADIGGLGFGKRRDCLVARIAKQDELVRKIDPAACQQSDQRHQDIVGEG